jgi:1-acyl-sn-glycerol-3-phosphate acyltransferase
VILARLPAALRRPIRIVLLLLHLAWGSTLVGLTFPWLPGAARERIVSRWARRLLRVLGVRLHAEQPPHCAHGALLVCNHVSWLDIYVILACRPVHFVSKAEVRAWPLIGWLAARTGTLFIERSRRADTARINAEMHALMDAGAWVAVFPEGTTGDGRVLKRFLPSLLQPAVALDCPVVPAALRYLTPAGTQSLAPAYIDDLSLWQSLMQIVGEPGLVARLRFGDPLQPDGHRRELAAQAEAATAGLLDLARADAADR